ncbi:hypothetical protein [Mycoplasmopsis bovis]
MGISGGIDSALVVSLCAKAFLTLLLIQETKYSV